MHHHIKRCALMAFFAFATRVEAQPTFSIDSAELFDAYTLVATIPQNGFVNLTHPMSGYMDTQQVDDVRDAWRNLIDQSLLDELTAAEQADATGSSNLAFLGFFATNGKNVSTFNQTTDRLDTLSVSSSTRSSMMGAFDEVVARGNQVNAICEVNNTGIFPVNGKVILFRISGRVRTEDNNERPFRALSRLGYIASGVGGDPQAQAICRYESTGLGPIIPSQPTQTTQTTSTDATSPGGTSATGQPLIDGTGDPSGSVRHGASSYVAVVAAFTSLALAAGSADYR